MPRPHICVRCRKPKPAEEFKSQDAKAPFKTCLPCRMYFRKHYSSRGRLPRFHRPSVHSQEDQEQQQHSTDDSRAEVGESQSERGQAATSPSRNMPRPLPPGRGKNNSETQNPRDPGSTVPQPQSHQPPSPHPEPQPDSHQGPEHNSDTCAAQSEQANSIIHQFADPYTLSLFALPQLDPDRSCPIDGCTSCFTYSIRV
ncbi:uncharacterized protein ASPGLDRAFT_45289 [Aspergillus glaucus CBS 516.65]|uniref:Uncharacterized protein n=1 Tax=Aspergillus glaucus CBS 516.65 TaxID=1160497 RepID=A0A1L9VQQ9_ASPGL|nr:hypothetical protein ASPGLDRAFT_45289 [Aspergillus glaucus CBS 516.65]OJJ86236.1 hypothetical protein ASPGLDRAFT_45289 [Aspergillus glaucus CBS 516.65]